MATIKPEHYLALFDGKLASQRGQTRYQPCDDGSHMFANEQEYYEWWYLDAAFDNGYHFVLTFHFRNVFLMPMIPTIQFFIYKPDGTKQERYEMIKPQDAFAHPDYCDVKMGGNYIKDMGDYYETFIKIGSLGAHLKLTKTVPSWKPGTGLIYLDKETGHSSGWSVPVPAGNIKGRLFLKEGEIQVKGHGYHDHNWGKGAMRRFFDYWYWGRIRDEKFCIVYANVVPHQASMPKVNPFLVMRDGQIVLSTNRLVVEPGDIQTEPFFNQAYANRLVLRAAVEGLEAHIVIASKRIAEKMKLPSTAERGQYYFRFIADYTMDITIDGVKEHAKGELLHEYIIL
ncbi:MAG: hypothetical protein HKP58_19185 [Desulfatitalea sp.]|nr:hypothetical protein [Desulfatitalea sp.]NNK02540.1 hypothetical protein [Desulfatitalea sp.]